MSDEAFSRAIARESKIWNPFVYSFPFDSNQTADRITIFGLYANSYLNGHKYLNEIEDEDLANLLTDYNSKIAELTAQEQIVVADIVSKRYLAGIDKLIHDQKMITKQAEIDSDDAIMDAKIAALAADQAALTTMATKVETETTKTEARITELEAYIEQEGINLSLADIEVVEKEISSAKLDNEKLNMANDILRIQIETVETAQELLEIDLKIAKTLVDIAQTDRDIARIGLLDNELTIEQAKTEIEEAGIPISAARIELAQAKYTDAEAEKLYVQNTLTAQETTSFNNKSDLLATKQTVRLNELIRKEELQLLENEKQREVSDLNVTLAEDDQEHQEEMDAKKIELIDNIPLNNWEKALAAIEVARTLAAANITTTLTHTIQKKATT
jgi:hypothetical protein